MKNGFDLHKKGHNMEPYILISWLNDFIYCPASIYFHQLYGVQEKILYQNESQLVGTAAHAAVDTGKYSTRAEILQGQEIYTSKYNICGKIDIFDIKKAELTERKNKISKIYDGYIFQVYAQYFGLKELGYKVEKIRIHSLETNKIYNIKLPTEDKEMLAKFENIINKINEFNIEEFTPQNITKCENCIYEPACYKSLIC